MSVFTGYANDDNVLTALFRDLQSFQNHAEKSDFSITELRPVTLRGMRAYRYVAWGVVDGQRTAREAIVAFTPSSDIEVFIYIQAPEAQYRKNRWAFNALLKSWRVSQRE